MIQLTRLNGQLLAVNSDLIKFVERSPDTMLTLVNGEKVIVRESMEQVISRIVEFRRILLAGLPQAAALLAPSARPITVMLPRDGQE
jgi:flagellar protein FlbD